MGSSKAQIVISSEPIYFCYRNRNFQCPVSDCLIATSLVWFHRRSVESLRFLPRIDSTLGISLRFSSLDPISLSTQFLNRSCFHKGIFVFFLNFRKRRNPPLVIISAYVVLLFHYVLNLRRSASSLLCVCMLVLHFDGNVLWFSPVTLEFY